MYIFSKKIIYFVSLIPCNNSENDGKIWEKIWFFCTWAHLLNTIHRPYFRCKLLYNWIQFTTISASSKSATPKTKLSISLCYQSDVFFRFFWWRRYNKHWSSIIKVVGTAGRDTCRNCNVAYGPWIWIRTPIAGSIVTCSISVV